MSRMDKSIETESRSVVAYGAGGGKLFWGDECSKIHCGDGCITLYTVSGQIIWDVNSISIKLLIFVCVWDELMNLLL